MVPGQLFPQSVCRNRFDSEQTPESDLLDETVRGVSLCRPGGERGLVGLGSWPFQGDESLSYDRLSLRLPDSRREISLIQSRGNSRKNRYFQDLRRMVPFRGRRPIRDESGLIGMLT